MITILNKIIWSQYRKKNYRNTSKIANIWLMKLETKANCYRMRPRHKTVVCKKKLCMLDRYRKENSQEAKGIGKKSHKKLKVE